MPFIYFGHLINILIKNFKNIFIDFYSKYKIFTLFIFIIFTVIVFLIWYKYSLINKRLDLNARNIRNFHLTLTNAFLGYYLFSLFSYIFYKIKFFKNIFSFIGQKSLYILAFHVPLSTYINLLITTILPPFILQYMFSVNIIYVLYHVITQLVFSILFYYLLKYIIIFLKNIN